MMSEAEKSLKYQAFSRRKAVRGNEMATFLRYSQKES